MPSIVAGVDFDTVAREWRLKWSEAEGKASLCAAQKLLDDCLPALHKLNGLQSVQRVVCGGCFDFKVVIALSAGAYHLWEAADHSPEKGFLEAAASIPGVTAVETQTYTLMACPEPQRAAVVSSATPPALSLTGSTPLEFFIFGHPVGMSPSPDIHNSGFACNGFPHRYSRCDTEGVDGVLAALASPSCGGGSVTIPHKESVITAMATLSASAKRIGCAPVPRRDA
jgi:hypothetical protein